MRYDIGYEIDELYVIGCLVLLRINIYLYRNMIGIEKLLLN